MENNENHNHATLEELQAAQLAAVTVWYEKEILLPNGVTFNGTIYQSDPTSWDRISKTMSVGNLPNNFYWLDANNNKVSFTLTDLQNLSSLMLQARFEVFNRFQNRKAEIRATTTEAEVVTVVSRQSAEYLTTS